MGSHQMFAAAKTPTAPPDTSNTFSLAFDGLTQYVTLPTNVVDPNSDFTIEMWIKVSSDTAFEILYSAWTGDSDYWFLINYGSASVDPGRGLCLQEDHGTGTNFICAGTAKVVVSDGWKHVAITRGGSTWKVYIDGSLVKTDTASPTLSTAAQQIASYKSGTLLYAGNIDEVRTWDVERTAGEINSNKGVTLTGSETNLTGYWRFEEGSGSTAVDSASTNDGTLIGSPTYDTDVPY